jgi:hypothetical protein
MAGVTVPVVAAVVVAVAVVEDAELGLAAGWGASNVAGDDIIFCMGDVSFFVTESAIEWSKGPVRVVSKPVAHLRRSEPSRYAPIRAVDGPNTVYKP